ncbi:MAG: VWA domain-containing protein [Planctomycetaceae bacterium]|nr:VWA domain-containing protein [Planctomycetaceae bacterium]
MSKPPENKSQRVPVPLKVPVSTTEQSDPAKIVAIGAGITFLLVILVLLFFLLSSNVSRQAGTSAQQASETESSESGQDQKTDNTVTTETAETGDEESSAEQATLSDEKTQAPNRTESEKKEQGYKITGAEEQAEEETETADKTTEPAETTNTPTRSEETNHPLSENSKNGTDNLVNGFSRGDVMVKVFGTTGKGSKFVFVFDHSGSMAGMPLETAKAELLQSLTSLKDNHQFNIIFYDDSQIVWKPGNQLIAATKQNKNDAENFIKKIIPAGGTEALRPILMAIDYKPDVIFFLTDGQLSLNLDNICNKRGETCINVIQFGSGNDKSALLQELARRTQGDYKYVIVGDLDAL